MDFGEYRTTPLLKQHLSFYPQERVAVLRPHIENVCEQTEPTANQNAELWNPVTSVISTGQPLYLG